MKSLLDVLGENGSETTENLPGTAEQGGRWGSLIA